MPSNRTPQLRKRALKRDSSFSENDQNQVDNAADSDTNVLDPSEIDEIDHNKREMQEKPKDPITLQKVLIRSATATALACLYMSIVNAGHFYCILAVFLTQVRIWRCLRVFATDSYDAMPLHRRPNSTVKS